MSYSYKFCKQRIKSKDLDGFEDVNFSKAAEYDIRSIIRADFLEKRKYDTMAGGFVQTEINYDPDCKNFQYFTSQRKYTDGTMCFVTEMIEELLQRVFICDTYYIPAGEPEDGDFLIYTIGNPIVIEEVDKKFAPKDAPWMCDRVTVMLPIFFEIKREEIE